jgi:hypothetical protein
MAGWELVMTDHVTADQMPGTEERPGWGVRGEPVAVATFVVAALGVALLFAGGAAPVINTGTLYGS